MIRQCDEVHRAIVDFLNEIPDELLSAPAYPEGWSAAKNMQHIIRSNRWFARYIGMPSWLFKLFGKPKKPNLKVEDLRATNCPRNFDYGSYPTPAAVKEGLKERLAADLLESARAMNKAIMKRTEEELDAFSGPFGGMSLRTFVFLAIKHSAHHTNVVKIRLAAAGR